jgi:sec-independent protein translocase protein TatC
MQAKCRGIEAQYNGKENNLKEMALTDHLEELRTRMLRILGILLIFFIICYGVGEQIQELLLTPLRNALSDNGKIVYLGLLDKVLAQFQMAFWSSIIVSSPFWFRELWCFIRPGLYDHEAKVIRPFIFVGFILFCLGVSFGYFLVFPFTFETIMGFGVQNIEATLSLRDYLILSSKVLVFLGILFQMPNVMLILGFMGLVNKELLSSSRRYVIAAFAVIAAMMTPPDVITMMALWIPLVVLYEVGLWAVVLIVGPYQARKNKDLANYSH